MDVVPISYFDRLPDVMLEIIIDFSCEDVRDFLKVGRTDRRWLECSRKTWIQERLKIDPRKAFDDIDSEDAMTARLQHIGACLPGLRELDPYNRELVNNEGLLAIC